MAILLIGPLLWLLAFFIVGLAVARLDVIEKGLALAGVSFCVSLVFQVLGRMRRVRRESE